MKKQQYLYRIAPRRVAMLSSGPTEQESQILKDHLAYLQRLAAAGVVLLAGRTQTSDKDTFGIVILEAESEGDAEHIMKDDPAVKNDVMDAQLFPYSIAVLSESIRA